MHTTCEQPEFHQEGGPSAFSFAVYHALPGTVLALPIEQICVEMLFWELYHFSIAANQSQVSDPVHCFTTLANRDLGHSHQGLTS